VQYIIDPCSSPKDYKDLIPEAIVIKSLDSLDWPKTMRSLYAKDVYIRPYGNNEATIRLGWGGTFAKWGIVVGPNDMNIPEPDMQHGGEYRLYLAPGAYVWHDVR
jgi:hypothetical protein